MPDEGAWHGEVKVIIAARLLAAIEQQGLDCQRRIHHDQRREGGGFLMKRLGEEPITLDPPGITIDRLFP